MYRFMAMVQYGYQSFQHCPLSFVLLKVMIRDLDSVSVIRWSLLRWDLYKKSGTPATTPTGFTKPKQYNQWELIFPHLETPRICMYIEVRAHMLRDTKCGNINTCWVCKVQERCLLGCFHSGKNGRFLLGITQCGSSQNGRFGEQISYIFRVTQLWSAITLRNPEDGGNMFSETSVLTWATQCNTLGDIYHWH
jgi:hypothetical protein